MDFLKYFFFVIFVVTAFAMFIIFVKSKKPLILSLLNAIVGLFALSIIDLTSSYTGVYIPINWFTVGGSGILGVPAVCGFLLLKLIFI